MHYAYTDGAVSAIRCLNQSVDEPPDSPAGTDLKLVGFYRFERGLPDPPGVFSSSIFDTNVFLRAWVLFWIKGSSGGLSAAWLGAVLWPRHELAFFLQVPPLQRVLYSLPE